MTVKPSSPDLPTLDLPTLDLPTLDELEDLSPFEVKALLLEAARHHPRPLDAGRGNPNWLASEPRAAFFSLGQFALAETARGWNEPGILTGMATREGIAQRLEHWIADHADQSGTTTLAETLAYAASKGFDPDQWVFELVDGILGDHYPSPDRISPGVEAVVVDFLTAELCAGTKTLSPLRLFAVEGGSAAMCYLFDSLNVNGVLPHGSKVALMVPAFTPYLEIPRLARYDFEIVEIRADAVSAQGRRTWQFPPGEIDKLADPSIAALFVINPSNPPSVMLAPETIEHLRAVVEASNPDLVIVTDDVYCTFADDFLSLLSALPRNTIAVYSFSKYFGATGWRIGVVGVCDDNVIDTIIARHEGPLAESLEERYEIITADVPSLAFIDRMVADSRQVALNHTAGLSGPQQVQMALFALHDISDAGRVYERRTRQVLAQRLVSLHQGLGMELDVDQYRAGYYAELDLMWWATARYGEDFARWLDATTTSLEVVIELAATHGVVILDGEGFASPDWTVRVSLANLPDEAYSELGARIASHFDELHRRYQARGGPPPRGPAAPEGPRASLPDPS